MDSALEVTPASAGATKNTRNDGWFACGGTFETQSPSVPLYRKGEGAFVIKFALKLARQSLRAARRVEESPGSAEQDAG